MIEGQKNGDSAQPLTVDSAANVLEGLLSDSSEEQQPEETTPDETPEAPSSEEEQGDEPASEEESSSEEETEPSEEGEPEESNDDEEQPDLIPVKVNGKESKVTLDELKKGYSREQDYTQKSQKLAEDRRKLETEATPERDGLRADRQRYASQLSELENALKSLVQEPDWDNLARENPELFADTRQAWKEHQKRIEQITEERTAAEASVKKDFAAQQNGYLTEQSKKLLEAIPAWTDKEVAKKESDSIVSYAKGLGFSEDEVKGVTDHRALVALRKAMLFDRAEAAKAEAKKTAQVKVEKVKVAAPGAKASKLKANDATRAKQRHAKVGSVDSAAEALQLMLDD